MKIRYLDATEAKARILDMAQLRIKVFREFPYIYDGSLEYEVKYLGRYFQSENACFVGAFNEQEEMVGLATGMPLADEEEFVQKPFLNAKINLREIYYFGESVLLPQYRGKGIGHQFFDFRERAAKKYGAKFACFCAVERPSDHPLRPENYRPLDEFWKSRGYQLHENLKAQFSWRDLNESQESEKTMIYRMKKLNLVRVALTQYPISYFNNLEEWKLKIENDWVRAAASEKADLILFPEYGSMELTSLLNESERADLKNQAEALSEIKLKFCEHLANLAQKYRILICAPSIPVVNEASNSKTKSVTNRTYVFHPNNAGALSKKLEFYQDKLFMTRFEDEEWGVSSGEKTIKVFKTEKFSFSILTCFDVEFSEPSILASHAGADLLLIPSCTETPKGLHRVHIGARARALENQTYVLVSQTVGLAPWSPAVDINSGQCAAYATPDQGFPEDGVLARGRLNDSEIVFIDLDLDKIQKVRKHGQVFNFEIHKRIRNNKENAGSNSNNADFEVKTVVLG